MQSLNLFVLVLLLSLPIYTVAVPANGGCPFCNVIGHCGNSGPFDICQCIYNSYFGRHCCLCYKREEAEAVANIETA